ncbi:YvrJ family protein [Romboutsia weinsteinii]
MNNVSFPIALSMYLLIKIE